jgi:hypothetical protein
MVYFITQKYQFEYNFVGLGMESVGIFLAI